MGTALRMNKKQILFLMLVILSLLVTTLIVLHAVTPNPFHAITVIYRH
jgi:uncharacterized membrane-anchored protein